MIGSDADHFALKQVDGKCYVFISHGGAHRQYATHVKHELEQYRLWCFVDNNDKRAAEDRLTLAQEGLNKCMVFVPILSDDSLKNPILVEQIKLAEKTGKPLFPIVLSQMKIIFGSNRLTNSQFTKRTGEPVLEVQAIQIVFLDNEPANCELSRGPGT